MCNYKHNELINIKDLKKQFRKSSKNYCIFEENKQLYKVKTKYTDVKTNKVFYVDDFYLVSSNSERIK